MKEKINIRLAELQNEFAKVFSAFQNAAQVSNLVEKFQKEAFQDAAQVSNLGEKLQKEVAKVFSAVQDAAQVSNLGEKFQKEIAKVFSAVQDAAQVSNLSEKLQKETAKEISAAFQVSNLVEKLQKEIAKEMDAWKFQYLGRKGFIQEVYSYLRQLDPEERAACGKVINDQKTEWSNKIQTLEDEIKVSEGEGKLAQQWQDVTLPAYPYQTGNSHLITKTIELIAEIFSQLGFELAQGPEVETEYYNFTALNFPEEHPSRDAQDSYYIKPGLLLRTHTSPVQIHIMENQPPPLQVIVPGKAYRRDTPDPSHTPMFHQVEGLMVDEQITMGDLKGVLEYFCQMAFGAETAMRFRPHFFPFTEPSAEVDIGCVVCKGAGCRTCKNTGWLEILGAGMVNPAVFEYVGYDPEKYTGFAFGMGVERIAMLRHSIEDIRNFFENDLRFLRQF